MLNSFTVMVVDEKIPTVRIINGLSLITGESPKIFLKWARESRPGDVFYDVNAQVSIIRLGTWTP